MCTRNPGRFGVYIKPGMVQRRPGSRRAVAEIVSAVKWVVCVGG
jgi:hypothetical protein